MEFHRGRLIDHVHLRVSDLEASKRFYRAVLQALGKARPFGKEIPTSLPMNCGSIALIKGFPRFTWRFNRQVWQR